MKALHSLRYGIYDLIENKQNKINKKVCCLSISNHGKNSCSLRYCLCIRVRLQNIKCLFCKKKRSKHDWSENVANTSTTSQMLFAMMQALI